MKELGIVIVAYNNADLILKQAYCIKRFCKDDYDIIVIDNSSNGECSEQIRYHSESTACKYIKTKDSTSNPSDSHAFACNVAYWKLKTFYKYFFFLDHDNFPIMPFSVREILGEKVMAGLLQVKPSGKKYFWPGCVMWNDLEMEDNLIDFSTNHEFGLDTGGNLYKVIDRFTDHWVIYFNEAYEQNPFFQNGKYNFYSIINNGMFMHFINSSNWANTLDNASRINGLFNVLDSKIA